MKPDISTIRRTEIDVARVDAVGSRPLLGVADHVDLAVVDGLDAIPRRTRPVSSGAPLMFTPSVVDGLADVHQITSTVGRP